MVEFKIRLNEKTRSAYIPKELANLLGNDITAIGNRTAVLFYPEGTRIEDILRSLEIITDDLKHAKDLQEKETSSNTRS